MKSGEINDMKTVLVSDDMYLAAGLKACDCRMLWLRSVEAMDYFMDRDSQRHLLIVDTRTQAVDFWRIQTRWRSNDCVVWMHPRGKDASGEKADHAETLISLGLGIADMLSEFARARCQERHSSGRKRGLVYLSGREADVLAMLRSGDSVAEIACKMELSVKSIYGHRSRVVKKYGYAKYCHFYHTLFSHRS